jgi:L-lactate dehydrogenase complex protein LldF
VAELAGGVTFLSRAEVELRKEDVRGRIRRNTEAKVLSRAEALGTLVDPDGLRDAARALRLDAIAHLPELLEEWTTRFEARGGQVHWAADADDAVRAVLDVVRRHGARLVSKGKSMASEEIHLNPALEAAGVEVVETDLGEFIIQLAGETPSHIIAPAIHHDRYSVAELFTEDAGVTIPPEIDAEARYAQRRLRQAFLSAGVGISGVNFAVAADGSICLVENEGNGRMSTAVPRVHIAVMGMERIVRDMAELDVMLGLIARVGTGQAITVYTNIITGPRRDGDADGPEELHVVVVDNGRSGILGTQFEEALTCIRCGACLNACPVYRQVGGHAYGSVYSGPIGAVLTPLLHPEDASARELSEASSLCGACWDACPVRIPLHDLLLELRRRDAPGDASAVRRAGFSGWSWLWGTGAGFALSRAATRVGLPAMRRLRRLPGWVGAWTRDRELPARRGARDGDG